MRTFFILAFNSYCKLTFYLFIYLHLWIKSFSTCIDPNFITQGEKPAVLRTASHKWYFPIFSILRNVCSYVNSLKLTWSVVELVWLHYKLGNIINFAYLHIPFPAILLNISWYIFLSWQFFFLYIFFFGLLLLNIFGWLKSKQIYN